jgi:hypothetical protein
MGRALIGLTVLAALGAGSAREAFGTQADERPSARALVLSATGGDAAAEGALRQAGIEIVDRNDVLWSIVLNEDPASNVKPAELSRPEEGAVAKIAGADLLVYRETKPKNGWKSYSYGTKTSRFVPVMPGRDTPPPAFIESLLGYSGIVIGKHADQILVRELRKTVKIGDQGVAFAASSRTPVIESRRNAAVAAIIEVVTVANGVATYKVVIGRNGRDDAHLEPGTKVLVGKFGD